MVGAFFCRNGGDYGNFIKCFKSNNIRMDYQNDVTIMIGGLTASAASVIALWQAQKYR